MTWDFEANTADELAGGIRAALLKGRVTETVATERIQIVHLMESLAKTSILQFPLRIKHTTDKVPDAHIEMGGRRVGMELTRIKFQDVEHGRALQRKIGGTLSVSSLYPTADKPRNSAEVARDGLAKPAMIFPHSPANEEQIWSTQAKITIEGKTAVLQRKNFAHGDEDWLVLVDTVGDVVEDASQRGSCLAKVLDCFWRRGWYSRVFLQDKFYRWQISFDGTGYTMLPRSGK